MRLFLMTACLSLAAGMALAGDLQIAVDPDFQDGDITWRGDAAGKGYEFVFDFRDAGGVVVLCGAGKFLDVTTKRITQQMMKKSYVEFNGKRVLQDISFFTKVPFNADVKKATATCRATTVKTKDAKGDFTLQLAGGSFRL